MIPSNYRNGPSSHQDSNTLTPSQSDYHLQTTLPPSNLFNLQHHHHHQLQPQLLQQQAMLQPNNNNNDNKRQEEEPITPLMPNIELLLDCFEVNESCTSPLDYSGQISPLEWNAAQLEEQFMINNAASSVSSAKNSHHTYQPNHTAKILPNYDLYGNSNNNNNNNTDSRFYSQLQPSQQQLGANHRIGYDDRLSNVEQWVDSALGMELQRLLNVLSEQYRDLRRQQDSLRVQNHLAYHLDTTANIDMNSLYCVDSKTSHSTPPPSTSNHHQVSLTKETALSSSSPSSFSSSTCQIVPEAVASVASERRTSVEALSGHKRSRVSPSYSPSPNSPRASDNDEEDKTQSRKKRRLRQSFIEQDEAHRTTRFKDSSMRMTDLTETYSQPKPSKDQWKFYNYTPDRVGDLQ